MAFNNSVDASTSGYQSITTGGVWNGRTFQAGSGISLTNADGTAGNTTISATSPSGAITWTLIQSQNVAALSTVNFTTSITTYNELMARYINVALPGGGLDFTIAYSNDGGSTYAMTGKSSRSNQTTPASTSPPFRLGFSGNDTINGWTFTENNNQTYIRSAYGMGATGTVFSGYFGYLDPQTRINAVQFTASGGSFGSGTIELWGR